jgi:hypothetical protein
MNLDEHCPDCGALWNGQNACGHCGHERNVETEHAMIISLPSHLAFDARVACRKIA